MPRGELSNELLLFGATESPCPDAADTDDSGVINISDSLVTLNYLFANGEPPAMPGPRLCGADPTEDELGCGEVEACR